MLNLEGAEKEAMDEVDDEAATAEKEDRAEEVAKEPDGKLRLDIHDGVDPAAPLPSAAAADVEALAKKLLKLGVPPLLLPLPNFGAAPVEPKLMTGKEKPAEVMAPLSFLSAAAAALSAVVDVGLGVSQAAHLASEFLLRVSQVEHSHVSAFCLAASSRKLIGAALPPAVAGAAAVDDAWLAAN